MRDCMNEKIYETHSPEETRELGRKIGAEAMPGELYTLMGDLGVGKTVFTQGIAEGLGITEPVCSRRLPSCRCTMKAGCRFTILMYTG